MSTPLEHASPIPVPCQWIGPIQICGPVINDQVSIPLATFESPLWPSTNRGASVSRLSGGIYATILQDHMTRSIVLETNNAVTTQAISRDIQQRSDEIDTIIQQTSRFARFSDQYMKQVGNLLFIRIAATTGDAAGHNMVTKAADAIIQWLLTQYPELRYVSISGNLCVDKKASSINAIHGRGKSVIADILIPYDVCEQKLKTTPDAIVQLHIKKNLIGGIAAGTLHTANAHFANMLLGFYLATGQDVANIVEGSQGIVHAETRPEGLYFSVTLPCLIVGTVGNGKHHPVIQENLQRLKCLNTQGHPGDNAHRLAVIAASTVLCGELSLLAAQTNPGELMRAHEKFERPHTTTQPLTDTHTCPS